MSNRLTLPHFDYGATHVDRRGPLVYGDDLFSPTYWKDDLDDYKQKIVDYLQKRRADTSFEAPFQGRLLRFRPDHLETVKISLQTFSGELANHAIETKLSNLIRQQYEHYTVAPVATTKTMAVGNIDQVVKETADLAIQMTNLRNNFQSQNGLEKAMDEKNQEYHEKYVTENKFKQKPRPPTLVVRNELMEQLQLYPELMATDAMNIALTLPSESKDSQAFAMASLLGWRYASLEDRTLGSPSDLGAIVMDMLAKSLSFPQTINNYSADSNNNLSYLCKNMAPIYEALMVGPLVGALEKHNADFVSLTGGATTRNPFVHGLVGHEIRLPDAYSMWCAYRASRTPFYNRVNVTSINWNNDYWQCLPFNLGITRSAAGAGQITLIPKVSDPGKIAGVAKAIKEQLKKVLPVQTSAQVGTFLSIAGEEKKSVLDTDMVNYLLESVIKRIPETQWNTIVADAFTSLIITFLQLQFYNWNDLNSKLSSPVAQQNVTFQVLLIHNRLVFQTRDMIDFSKHSFRYHNILRKRLRANAGISATSAMGGTGMIWDQSMKVVRSGMEVVYPGDEILFENVKHFMDLFLVDLQTIEVRLERVLNRFADQYWYRDVVRWLEVLYQVLDPLNAALTRNTTQQKRNFDRLERILQMLYVKQIAVMRDFLKKSALFERRIQQNKSTDPYLEKQIQLSSIFTLTVICYLKRQITIVFKILNLALNTRWAQQVAGPHGVGVRDPPYPTLQTRIRLMRLRLQTWFRSQLGAFSQGVRDPKALELIRTLGRDNCGPTRKKAEVETNKFLQNPDLNKIVTDIQFWKLLQLNLKKKTEKDLNNPLSFFYGLYIPICQEKGNNQYQYWLFDLMPLVLEGKFTGTFGAKSVPQWLTAKALASQSFTEKNKAIVVLTNTTDQLTGRENWRGPSITWLNKLVAQAQKAGGKERSLWILRFSVYLLLQDPVLYRKFSTCRIRSVGDVEQKDGEGYMRQLLAKYQVLNDQEKKQENKEIDLVPRDLVAQEITLSLSQYQMT